MIKSPLDDTSERQPFIHGDRGKMGTCELKVSDSKPQS